PKGSRPKHRTLVAVLVVLGVLAVIAIGELVTGGGILHELRTNSLFDDRPASERDTWRAIDTLMAQPSFEDTVIEFENTAAEMRAALDRVVPGLTWQEQETTYWSGLCGGDYLYTNASSVLMLWSFEPRIDPDHWGEAEAALAAIAAKHGFTDRAVTNPNPDSTYVEYFGAPVTSFDVTNRAEEGYSSISFAIDCRLTQEVRDRIAAGGIPYSPKDADEWRFSHTRPPF
ncbi:MAG: LppA family lipoprotein, partial [Bifidobacteriaceae bacterium]|nr:LppA family lipoprotein [Bifidobacteriaceae bacterium]